MWATIIIRFLRRRLILGLIFTISLCYCVFSFWGQADFLDNDELVPVRRTQPFIWRTLQQHNSSGNDGEVQCRNSIQGRILIVDDRGFVCYRQEVLPNGCCNDTPNSFQYNCVTCLKNHCCSVYEHCVSCCLHPDKRNMLETILGKAQEQNSVLFASVTDHFELCLAKCRTNSQSVQHENSYKDPKAKHCYGDMPPGTHIVENQA